MHGPVRGLVFLCSAVRASRDGRSRIESDPIPSPSATTFSRRRRRRRLGARVINLFGVAAPTVAYAPPPIWVTGPNGGANRFEFASIGSRSRHGASLPVRECEHKCERPPTIFRLRQTTPTVTMARAAPRSVLKCARRARPIRASFVDLSERNTVDLSRV